MVTKITCPEPHCCMFIRTVSCNCFRRGHLHMALSQLTLQILANIGTAIIDVSLPVSCVRIFE